VTGLGIDRLREKNLRLMRPGIVGYVQNCEEFIEVVANLFRVIGGIGKPGFLGDAYPLNRETTREERPRGSSL
jgi:hypothetical protein